MSLFVVSLTTVLVALRPKRGKDTMKPPTKDKMHASLPSKMPKRQLLRDLRKLLKHGRPPSARPASQPTRLLKHVRLLRVRRVKPLRDLRRPPEHGRLPRTRPVRPLIRDPRRLLRRRRLPRRVQKWPAMHGDCEGEVQGGRRGS